MKKCRCLRGAGAAFMLFAAACAHRVAVAPGVPPEGRTSFRALNPSDVGQGTIEAASESITPAYASPTNKAPEYPAYALKAGCRGGVVPVRVFVGPDGNVTSQRDIPERPLPGDTCHLAFRAAVQGAIDDWKFAPAYRMKAVPGPARDGQPGLTAWEQTPIAIYLDFEFTFAVVAGQGVVRSR
jgi:hypothetical protein